MTTVSSYRAYEGDKSFLSTLDVVRTLGDKRVLVRAYRSRRSDPFQFEVVFLDKDTPRPITVASIGEATGILEAVQEAFRYLMPSLAEYARAE